MSETENLTHFLQESATAFQLYFTPVSRIYSLNEVYIQITHTVESVSLMVCVVNRVLCAFSIIIKF